MPHSLILNLQPRSPISPSYLTGKHLHALFLTLVSSVDRALGDRLHEQKTEKAFTLSPLQIANRSSKGHLLQWEHSRPIPAAASCWWRISLLDDSLFGHLTPLWLNLNPSHSWHLGSANLHITSVLGTPQSTQPWANFHSYAQLFEQASEQNRQLTFTFSTPATFRQGKYDSSLPTRECVVNSLLSRWNRYSGIPLPETLMEFLFPNFFDIQTELVHHPEGKWAGCVGTVSYRILGEVSAIAIKQINALADFALYSGVGRKTPMGMGDGEADMMNDYIPIAALNQYTYCPHRCWRMFCLNEFTDNQYTIEGTSLHDRVHTTNEVQQEETWQIRAVWLKSEQYHLIGKSDLIEENDGCWYPVEYKRGHRGEFDNDELQVCAQALCIEEMTGQPVTLGYVYYAQSHQRQAVEITTALRQQAIATIEAVTQILNTGAMPPATYSPRCKGCSLYSQCLPKAADKVKRYREEL